IVVQNENTLYAEHLGTLMFLRYSVTQEPTVEIPHPAKAFHEVQPIWLYDEIDLVQPGVFSHEILLSNGRVIRLVFQEFALRTANWGAPPRALNLRQTGYQESVST